MVSKLNGLHTCYPASSFSCLSFDLNRRPKPSTNNKTHGLARSPTPKTAACFIHRTIFPYISTTKHPRPPSYHTKMPMFRSPFCAATL